MLRWVLAAMLLFSFESSAFAFWGALAKGLSKAAGSAGKAAGSAGKAAGAAKVAKPLAAGAAAGAVADDAARGAGKAAGLGDEAARAGDEASHLGDDVARFGDDAPPAAAAESEAGPGLGDAIDVASNVVPTGEEEGASEAYGEEEDETADLGAALLGQITVALVVGLFVVRLVRKRLRR